MGSYERYGDWWEEALDDYEAAELLVKPGKYSKACASSLSRLRRKRLSESTASQSS